MNLKHVGIAASIAGLLGSAVFGYALFVGRSSEPSSRVSGAEEQVDEKPTRHFRQPEEEQRFVEAVTQGKQKSIATLEQALARAKARDGVKGSGKADPAYVAELERQLAERRAELREVSR